MYPYVCGYTVQRKGETPQILCSSAMERRAMPCQDDILKGAAILDAGQEGVEKVSCCFLPSPENYTLFSLERAAQCAAAESQVEN